MAFRHKKLKEWVEAGLMTQDQASTIQSFEDTKKNGRFGRGLIFVSIFAILVGVLSIIASNWHEIPSWVKIFVHVILNIGVGFFAFHADKKGKDVWREGATFAFFGLTMTLIILIGQVYQLTGSPANASLLWFISTLLFMALMARGFLTALVWLLAVVTTIFLNIFEHGKNLPDEWGFYLLLGASAYFPPLLFAGGTWRWLQKNKKSLADVSFKFGAFWIALSASVSALLWPFMPELPDSVKILDILVIFLIGLVGFVFYALKNNFYKQEKEKFYAVLFALVSFVLAFLPLFFGSGISSLIGAIAFIAYWIFVGWIGQIFGKMWIVSLAISFIALRVFIVYLELFKDLMTTGVGLISAGIIMLFLIYAARKLNTRLTKKADA